MLKKLSEILEIHWFFKFVIIFILASLILFFFLYVLPKILPTRKVSNSEIKGIIFENQVWEGTIRITGDILTTPVTTITVKPGTQILVKATGDRSNFDYLPWHLKSGVNTGGNDHGVYKDEPFWDEGQKIQVHLGKFIAIGSKEAPIIIRSDALYGSPYDFNVFSFRTGILSFVNLSNYRRLEVGAGTGIDHSIFEEIGECAVCINGGRVTISKNHFGRALRQSIWSYRGSPEISDNLFNSIDGEAIVLDSKRVGIVNISHNKFEMPGKIVIDALSGDERDSGKIEFNQFSGTTMIRLPCDSKLRVENNNIMSLISFWKSGCGGKYIFGPNYWGTEDIDTIMKERIINKDRKFQVEIPSILNSPVKDSGIRN